MSKFHARSTALEVIEGHDLKGYEIIVTGGASGIGVETVRALAKAGARVIIATRNLANAEAVAQQLRTDTGNNNIEAEQLDLTSLKNVRAFVERYLAKKRPLHILINNAGVMATPHEYTEDGFEMQFGTNHMGHFALTLGLLPALKQGANSSGRHSRVVNVSSLAHIRGGIDFDDINFLKRPYDKWVSYGQSKTANMLFSIGLTKHFSKDGIYSNSLMPGGIMTGLQKHMPTDEKIALGLIDQNGKINERLKTTEQGASTTIWAAVAPEFESVGGLYLENCKISSVMPDADSCYKSFEGHLAQALDEKDADRLWQMSEEFLKNPPKKA